MDAHYSIESLEEIAGGDEDFMKVVAQTFLDEIPPDLAALEEAIANNNKDLAYQFAHKMKPNFEMFGLGLEKDITGIESWTKSSKSSSTVSDNIEKVVATVSTVVEELKRDFNL
ncbi:Hpt domain-containing protein [Rasiella sp. SM2506]|uniref:Hpt domain-containing protein n=1 Tax=Rasiella sp. SM2506 TaxID=3423914 RepID=UPI003D79E9C1